MAQLQPHPPGLDDQCINRGLKAPGGGDCKCHIICIGNVIHGGTGQTRSYVCRQGGECPVQGDIEQLAIIASSSGSRLAFFTSVRSAATSVSWYDRGCWYSKTRGGQPSSNPGRQEDMEDKATAQAGPQEDTEHTATAQADPSTPAGPQEDTEHTATAQADPSTSAGPQEDMEDKATAQADPSTPAGPQEDMEDKATAQADPSTPAGRQEDTEHTATAQADPSTPAGPQEDMEDKATAQAGPQEDTEHTATEQAGPSTTTTSLPWQNNTFALSRWIVSGMEELVNKRKAHMKEERETVKRRRHAKDRETLEDSQYIRELVAKLRQEIEEKKNTKENLAKAKEAKTTQ
ncbi:hypothetical protein E2C01_043151 [Portunus trituberculatus]|uniref:Uncharacterized protein n=1 Tax=Portunus trituberculatus TaxID=210409 RepID=A0A5B7FPH6_PORTR|nr:hypothetical protein [Portunus trituberculatus]